jgi:hypothetical protein
MEAQGKARTRFIPTGATIFGALLAAACDLSTAPNQLRVTLSGPQVIQGSVMVVNNVSVYGCNYPLTATATGGSTNEVATWIAAYWSSSQKDTAYATDVSAIFPDNPTLASGTSVTVNQVATVPLPAGPSATFEYAISVYYSTPQNSYASAAYSFVCE